MKNNIKPEEKIRRELILDGTNEEVERGLLTLLNKSIKVMQDEVLSGGQYQSGNVMAYHQIYNLAKKYLPQDHQELKLIDEKFMKVKENWAGRIRQ